MASRKHAHKYFYGRMVGNTRVWSCALPECSHYMPSHMVELVEGKLSICWSCNEKFVLDPTSMERAKPICDECLGLVLPTEDLSEKLRNERLSRVGRVRDPREPLIIPGGLNATVKDLDELRNEQKEEEPKGTKICPFCNKPISNPDPKVIYCARPECVFRR